MEMGGLVAKGVGHLGELVIRVACLLCVKDVVGRRVLACGFVKACAV